MSRTAEMDARSCAGHIEQQLDGANVLTKPHGKRGAWQVEATYGDHTVRYVFDAARSGSVQFDLAQHEADRLVRMLQMADAETGL